MVSFKWDSKFDVSVESMNQQHKTLLQMMDHLSQKNHQGAPKIEILRLLSDLEKYTVSHFTAEEKYMESIHFEGLTTHKLIHERLLKTLTKHVEDYKSGNGDKLPEEFFFFLLTWISGHIQSVDTKYGQHQLSRKTA